MGEIIIFSIAIAILVAIFAKWPEIALYTMAFFIPVIGFSSVELFPKTLATALERSGMSVPFIDFLALVILFSYVLHILLDLIQGRKEKIAWPLFFPFLIFIIISLLSDLNSGHLSSTLWYSMRYLVFLYLAFIFVPYNLITNGKIMKKTIHCLFFSSLIVLVSGFISLYGQDWHNSFFRINTISWFGIYPFGENQNLIAEFLNVGVWLVVVLKTMSRNQRLKRWYDLVFVLMGLGIILTFSRAGWITLAVQLSIYGFWYLIKSKKQSFLPLILGVAAILVIISPLAWKMMQLQKSNVSSTENRWLLTEIAWQSFRDKPLLGQGSGRFVDLVADNIRFTVKYGDPLDSHGMFQKVLAENGAFGLAAWCFILACLIKEIYRSLRKFQADNPWLLPLALAAAGALFFQIFNTSYYKGKVWLPIAVFLAAVRLLETRYARKKCA